MRFENDLFVFILFWFGIGFFGTRKCLRIALEDTGEALWGPRDRLCDAIRVRYEHDELLEPGLEEGFFHPLIPAFEEEFGAHSVAFSEPFGCFTGFEAHVVLSSAHLDLDFLGLRDLSLRSGDTFSFLQLVLKLTIIHDFRNGRDGVWRYLN